MDGFQDTGEFEVVAGEVVSDGEPPARAPREGVGHPAPRPGRMPAALPAAAAISGFIAGATVMALARRAAARRLGQVMPPTPASSWPDRDRWAVGESRTFLVNVRLISRPGG